MKATVLFLCLVLCGPLAASGETIIGNYPPENDVTQAAGLTHQRIKAMGFTMPTETGMRVGELVLRLQNYTDPGEVVVRLHEDSGDPEVPGDTVLMTFAVPPPGGAEIQDYILTPTNPEILLPGTTYWLLVSGIDGGSFDWMASFPAMEPVGLASFESARFSTSEGSQWDSSSILNTFRLRGMPVDQIGNYPTNDGAQAAGLTDQRIKAMGFTMLAGTDWEAGELILRLRNYTDPGEVVVQLRDDSGDPNVPGDAVVLSFDAPAPGGEEIRNYAFSPAQPFTLQADTTYWLIVLGINGGSFDWMASWPGIAPTGVASFQSAQFTTNGGSSWNSSIFLNTFFQEVLKVDQIFRDRFQAPD